MDGRLLQRIAHCDRLARGFDCDSAEYAHFSLAPADGRRKLLDRPLEMEDVRGTLAGIGEVAGWWALTLPTDPQSETVRECLGVVAQELEQMALALRLELALYDEHEGETE